MFTHATTCIGISGSGLYGEGEQFWGRGIMTEAVTAVTDSCFDNFPLHRISGEVFANNPASVRVLENPVSFSKDASRTTW